MMIFFSPKWDGNSIFLCHGNCGYWSGNQETWVLTPVPSLCDLQHKTVPFGVPPFLPIEWRAWPWGVLSWFKLYSHFPNNTHKVSRDSPTPAQLRGIMGNTGPPSSRTPVRGQAIEGSWGMKLGTGSMSQQMCVCKQFFPVGRISFPVICWFILCGCVMNVFAFFPSIPIAPPELCLATRRGYDAAPWDSLLVPDSCCPGPLQLVTSEGPLMSPLPGFRNRTGSEMHLVCIGLAGTGHF